MLTDGEIVGGPSGCGQGQQQQQQQQQQTEEEEEDLLSKCLRLLDGEGVEHPEDVLQDYRAETQPESSASSVSSSEVADGAANSYSVSSLSNVSRGEEEWTLPPLNGDAAATFAVASAATLAPAPIPIPQPPSQIFNVVQFPQQLQHQQQQQLYRPPVVVPQFLYPKGPAVSLPGGGSAVPVVVSAVHASHALPVVAIPGPLPPAAATWNAAVQPAAPPVATTWPPAAAPAPSVVEQEGDDDEDEDDDEEDEEEDGEEAPEAPPPRPPPDLRCPLCSKDFSTPQNLRHHRQEIHEGGRGAFTCGDCGQIYSRLHSLERHQNKHHLRESPQCRICRKRVINFDLHYRKFHCKSKCVQAGPRRRRKRRENNSSQSESAGNGTRAKENNFDHLNQSENAGNGASEESQEGAAAAGAQQSE